MDKIVILNFSSRENGNCSSVAKFIADYYNRTNVLIENVGKVQFKACGSCNYECLKEGSCCQIINENESAIYKAISSAKLVYFIIPNYCGFPCSNYFIFNERSVGYFNKEQSLLDQYMSVKKCFIFISNTEDTVFNAAALQQGTDPDIFYLKASKYNKRSIDGDILDSATVRSELTAFLDSSRS